VQSLSKIGEKMIKSELDFVWITTDGKKFLNKRDAEDRQRELGILEEDKNESSGVVDLWISKLKGE
tara:strand:- start:674 stop:871 length:198 start_codon:yes stop_codon:yes gene_type:complete